MIEVEQKFILSEDDIRRLTRDAEFVSEKTFTDIYFDTDDYALTKNDMWLRRRGEGWELKIPMREKGNRLVQQYDEVEGEDAIRQVFGIAPLKDFAHDIAAFGYAPFCQCLTTRKKFRVGEFGIDLDTVTYGGEYIYRIGEIELMVADKSQISEAISRIESFARDFDLPVVRVRGKVLEYLKMKKPAHYQALVDAGVVIESVQVS